MYFSGAGRSLPKYTAVRNTLPQATSSREDQRRLTVPSVGRLIIVSPIAALFHLPPAPQQTFPLPFACPLHPTFHFVQLKPPVQPRHRFVLSCRKPHLLCLFCLLHLHRHRHRPPRPAVCSTLVHSSPEDSLSPSGALRAPYLPPE
ncbi:hypothetical protein M430DRAFT_263220 [Amorphotheca resinae ATCC 22711]|uniref:Uncharacterized protein n=1 Tax=Amorphotheca resinae ATCC 22711 TaxID=857342 RepID=A0A2T3AWD9_AMORE|nr:hypothetical protein M430DRAFT_263220 [Amorphotheca resinae ATCC 22711]PSS12979.1 hypothetical protein M430DRAFT_263220 [Amorphotheca resinae ATCC 22711]